MPSDATVPVGPIGWHSGAGREGLAGPATGGAGSAAAGSAVAAWRPTDAAVTVGPAFPNFVRSERLRKCVTMLPVFVLFLFCALSLRQLNGPVSPLCGQMSGGTRVWCAWLASNITTGMNQDAPQTLQKYGNHCNTS